jgi:hypothetical protein
MFNRRTWKYWSVGVALLAVVAVAYTPARQFHRFFPQDGVFVIGTVNTPVELLTTVVKELQSKSIPLARKNNLGASLATPGLMTEGSFITRGKRWLGIYSLGEHTSEQNIPLITTEVPWSWPSMDERIEAQVTAVLVAINRHEGPARPAVAPATGASR